MLTNVSENLFPDVIILSALLILLTNDGYASNLIFKQAKFENVAKLACAKLLLILLYFDAIKLFLS